MTTTETIATSASSTWAAGQKDHKTTQIAGATLHLGDCLGVMRTLPDNSVDSIVTDPPYGLNFMGNKWDCDVPGIDVWAECLRVLKPGGHLLAFSGTRTQHRMACRIEDAGFEIRDMIAWVYGSGFPKSMDISKAIDKAAGKVRDVVGLAVRCDGRVPELEPGNSANKGYGGGFSGSRKITAPATESARQWQGWGTALKPALEPITMARKPFACTVADNVMIHGTGALNIDWCRVPAPDGKPVYVHNRIDRERVRSSYDTGGSNRPGETSTEGRWPANLIHDGSTEVVSIFPDTASGGYPPEGGQRSQVATYGAPTARGEQKFTSNEGTAARFFYSAKASNDDRDNGNHHPTVKPTDLMHYLLRLVTPPGGISLDPYMGSGSTGKAASIGQFRFIGIERDPDYFAIACDRIKHASAQGHLFSATT